MTKKLSHKVQDSSNEVVVVDNAFSDDGRRTMDDGQPNLKPTFQRSNVPTFQRAEVESVLKARAAALAEEPTKEGNNASLDILEFRLANETYGVQSSYVREVYPLKELTPLPCTPPFVLGVINIRGQIFSLIDLRKFLDLSDQEFTNQDQVIIVRAGSMEVALLADAIKGVQSHLPEEISPALPALTGACAPYLMGVTQDRLLILDIEKLFADPRIIVGKEDDG